MRFVAIILTVICLIWVGKVLATDLGDFYFGEARFYFFLCLCFIVNLIALRRRKKAKALRKNKEPDEKQRQE